MKKILVGVVILIFAFSSLSFIFAHDGETENVLQDMVYEFDDDLPEDVDQEPFEEPAEDPTEDTDDNPDDNPIDDPEDNPDDNPIDDPEDNPDDNPIDDPEDNPIDDPEDELLYIYFSEIAWMGTKASANDEWIELYNPNDFPVDLSGWVITNPNLTFQIILSGEIDPNGYFLLERTDDTTVNDIPADQIYTGVLKNDGEILSLINPLDEVIDFVDAWYAGDNASKTTMARADFDIAGNDASAWCMSDVILINGIDANGDPINGTPRETNNCVFVTEDPDEEPPPLNEEEPNVNNPPVPIIRIQLDSAYMRVNVTGEDSYDPDRDKITYFWDYGDGTISTERNPKSYYYDTPGSKTITLTVTDTWGLSATATEVFVATEKNTSVNNEPTSSSESEPDSLPASYIKGAVTIDSALPNPEGNDNGAELIILKNNTEKTIDLKGWKIADLKGFKVLSESLEILPFSTLMLTQDIFKIILNNTNETIYLYDPAGNLMDEMSWVTAPSGKWLINLSFLYDDIPAKVVRVIDGDTIKVFVDNREMTVRLIGVDTPETVHPNKEVEFYGKEASDYLADLLEDKTITLAFDKNKIDVYGRLLAYVYLDDLFVNEEIIRLGYGYAYTNYPFIYLDEFVLIEAQAKANGIGIWANSEIADMIIDLVAEQEIDPILNLNIDQTINPINCFSPYLKIHSILPAPQKGEGVEFIKLINTGTETVCLNGWILDDITDGGSKPFVIRDGSISAGEIKTFNQDETKIVLNNSNDCATLISPNGEIADQICYGIAHANEIFTHKGGDWVPKTKVSSKTASKKTSSASSSKSPKRETIAYKYDLKTSKIVGNLVLVYEDDKLIYLTLSDDSIIRMSYAGSFVDISMTKQIIDINQPVEVHYLAGDDVNHLISIKQAFPKQYSSSKTFPLFFMLILFPISLGLYLWRRKYC